MPPPILDAYASTIANDFDRRVRESVFMGLFDDLRPAIDEVLAATEKTGAWHADRESWRQAVFYAYVRSSRLAAFYPSHEALKTDLDAALDPTPRWRPNPVSDPEPERWWDGAKWTNDVRDVDGRVGVNPLPRHMVDDGRGRDTSVFS